MIRFTRLSNMTLVSSVALLVGVMSCGKKKEKTDPNLVLTIKDSADLSVDFGTVGSGSAKSKTLTIHNSGENPAENVKETGLAAPFQFKGGSFPGTDGTCTSTIDGGATCTIVVEYAPSITPYTTKGETDKIVIDYGKTVEMDVKGTGDHCSTPESIAALTSSAVDASISYENTTHTMAQSFTPTEAFKLADVTAVLKKGSAASIETVVLRLRDSASNVPGASDLATASIAGSIVGTSNTEVNFRFSAPVQLTANTTYWLIIDPGTNNISSGTTATYFYWIGSYSDTWSGGKLILGTDSFNSWNDIGYDANFSVKKCNVIP